MSEYDNPGEEQFNPSEALKRSQERREFIDFLTANRIGVPVFQFEHKTIEYSHSRHVATDTDSFQRKEIDKQSLVGVVLSTKNPSNFVFYGTDGSACTFTIKSFENEKKSRRFKPETSQQLRFVHASDLSHSRHLYVENFYDFESNTDSSENPELVIEAFKSAVEISLERKRQLDQNTQQADKGILGLLKNAWGRTEETPEIND